MSTVFISYRRQSASGEARALFNDLAAQLGQNSVFMDVDSIALGRDFRGVLQEILGRCDLMLVLIDRTWVAAKDERGRARLENPDDYIRLEIETALRRNIIVTPVLVQGADMPAPEQLPPEIKDLAYRNGFELDHRRWESDVHEMVRRLGLNDTKRGRGRSFHWISKHRAISLGITFAVVILLAAPAYYVTQYLNSSSHNALPSPPRIPPPSARQFGIPDYVGSWVNTDPTRGMTRIELRYAAGKPTVQIWGKCHPNDCDWGVVDATPFRSSIASSSEVTSLKATFKPSFAEEQVTLHLVDKDLLDATVMTHFTDGSGRADYESTEKFRRS